MLEEQYSKEQQEDSSDEEEKKNPFDLVEPGMSKREAAR